jgi:hypothetical protein
MEVKKIPLSGCMQIILAVFSLGIGPLMISMQERSWPQLVDEQGLVTRGGKRIAWNEFTKATKVITRIGSSDGTTVHYELRYPQGKVIVMVHRLQNGQQVADYILNRLPESAFQPNK